MLKCSWKQRQGKQLAAAFMSPRIAVLSFIACSSRQKQAPENTFHFAFVSNSNTNADGLLCSIFSSTNELFKSFNEWMRPGFWKRLVRLWHNHRAVLMGHTARMFVYDKVGASLNNPTFIAGLANFYTTVKNQTQTWNIKAVVMNLYIASSN